MGENSIWHVGIELDAGVVEVVQDEADEHGNENWEIKPEMDPPGPSVVIDRVIVQFTADKHKDILQREEHQEEPLMGDVVSLKVRGFKLPRWENKPDVGNDVNNL